MSKAFHVIQHEPRPVIHAITPTTEYVFPQSYSWYIQDGILARLKALPMFGNVAKWAKNKFFIKQHDVFPFVGVYLMNDTMGPDGDSNAGAPHYLNSLKLGFSVVIANNDPDVLAENLDQAYWAIMNLLTYQRWHSFEPPTPGAPLIEIEAFTRGFRDNWYGNSPLNNDSPIGELRLDLTFTYRVILKPVVRDDLNLIHEEVVMSWPYDPNERPDIIVQYDFVQLEAESSNESANQSREAPPREDNAPPKRNAVWR